MTRRIVPALLAPAFLGLSLLAGCAAVTANPYPPVPAPMVETIPNPPVSAEALRWRPGYWNWTGTAYTWTPGQFVPMPGTSNSWMPGHWSQTAAGWVWVPAGWVL